MLSKFRSKFTQASANKFAPIPPEKYQNELSEICFKFAQAKIGEDPSLTQQAITYSQS